MILERIRLLLEEVEDIDPLEVRKILNMFDKNDPLDAVYKKIEDDYLGTLWLVECPSCGENLRFDRYSQIIQPYNFCYRCGQKLNKKDEIFEKDA